MRMFDYESPKPKEPVDYTGLKIVAILAPVFFLLYLPRQRRYGIDGLHHLRNDDGCRQNPLVFEETHLVLGDHCCYLGAPRRISLYGSLAPSACAYPFLYDANRNRGFSDHSGSCWFSRKILLEKFFGE